MFLRWSSVAVPFAFSPGNGMSSWSSCGVPGNPVLSGCPSCLSSLLAGAARGGSRNGSWQRLRMFSVVAFFPYREISDRRYIKKKKSEGEKQMWIRAGKAGREPVGLLAVTENRWNAAPRNLGLGTQARIAEGLSHWGPESPAGVLDAGGEALQPLAGRHSPNLQGGWVAGPGWAVRPPAILPGANARHKSRVSRRGDFQSCRRGIIKSN